MSKLVDLTLTLREGMPTWPSPWHPLVSFKQMGRLGMEHRRSYEVTFGTHTGTHMDSPAHMVENGITIDMIPLEVMVGKAKVIDFSKKGRGDKITVEDLKNCGTKIEKGDRLMFKTGWYKNFGSCK